MLERPDIQDEEIVACLQDEYGLSVTNITFLPLGADVNTAVYSVIARERTHYFCKLRGGNFDEASVTLPQFLNQLGIEQIITPLTTKDGRLWTTLDAFKVILYPYVEGRNGYETDMTDQQWRELGSALKMVHAAQLPSPLIASIRRETYSPKWRQMTREYLELVEKEVSGDSAAVQTAALLRDKRDQILDLVTRAERLAHVLQTASLEPVLCHSDIHAGNVLIGADGSCYIVDWDDPILAPKERDLMYIGGGLMGLWRTPSEEETPFYQGYGQTQIDPVALAYYRYERIVQDIALFSDQILEKDEGGDDREQSLRYLKSNFLPGNTIEIAYQSDSTDSR